MKKNLLIFVGILSLHFKSSYATKYNFFNTSRKLSDISAYLNFPKDNATIDAPELPSTIEYKSQEFSWQENIPYITKAQIGTLLITGIGAAATPFNAYVGKTIFKVGLLANFTLSVRPALDFYLQKKLVASSYKEYTPWVAPVTFMSSLLGGSWALFSK